MVISSHHYGNYIPVTLDEEKVSVDALKRERNFLKFVICMKNNPLPLVRLFDISVKQDCTFKQSEEGAELWRVPTEDLTNLMNEINKEIMRRLTKQFVDRSERHEKYERLEKEHKSKRGVE